MAYTLSATGSLREQGEHPVFEGKIFAVTIMTRMNTLLHIKNYRNLLRLLPHLPHMGRLCWRLWRDRRVPKYLKGMVIVTLLYVLSPIDLIPEFFVPFIGQLDDATLLLVASYLLIRWSPREVVNEHMASRSTILHGRLRLWR
jgi:uncharacterized membrane protein YkvA (DUF1232 family)